MNQKGYVTTALLILMPLLLAILAVAAASYLIFKDDGKSRHLCRLELLRAQAEVATDLKTLLALNPNAKVLRLRRKIAEAKVAATVGSPANAAALAELRLVISAQSALAAKQRALIAHAKIVSRSSPLKTAGRIRFELQQTQRSRTEANRYSSIDVGTASAAFDVVATPIDSPTPDYQPSPSFRDRQEMKVTWTFDVSSFLPDWIRPLVHSANLSGQAECSATLEKENNRWVPRITRVKS